MAMAIQTGTAKCRRGIRKSHESCDLAAAHGFWEIKDPVT
jgi:hypothetical protein